MQPNQYNTFVTLNETQKSIPIVTWLKVVSNFENDLSYVPRDLQNIHVLESCLNQSISKPETFDIVVSSETEDYLDIQNIVQELISIIEVIDDICEEVLQREFSTKEKSKTVN